MKATSTFAHKRVEKASPDGAPAPGIPRIRVAAIILEDDALLLVRHIKNGKSYWLLPGGGIEYGEPLAEALRRELREEACVEIDVGDLVIVNDTIPPGNRRHTINMCFTATIQSGAIAVGSDPRVVEVRFVPVAEIESLTFYPDIRHELMPALRAGFPRRASYLGNLWKE
ncbi:MAG TPA: NUDIX domain-containing protein [Candidatus Hydrogenedentes bacterium]|nr:NUDIX domain-containing protein [Candidatus Hydrogenedentota bacterium]HRK34728.1 NUDIX domain-containing protein [Candidatus Hydrogenedentota bacterium]